jgi:hypothetical protein
VIKIFLTLLFLISTSWGKTTLELSTPNPLVKQGSIIDCKLSILESEGNSILVGLTGREFGKTIYIISIDPFVQMNGVLEANARVVFEKVPEAPSASEVIAGQEVIINWNKIKVEKSKPAEKFLFGDFDVPQKLSLIKWLIITLVSLGLTLILLRWRKKSLFKKKLRAKKIDLKAELLKPTSYDQIVELWKNKHRYLSEFPELDQAFKKLEETLFKYQFKSQRSEIEITQVLLAFDHFKNDVSGVLHGI